jgi:HEAT repeat protein
MLDNAFEALKKYDWGSNLDALAPIDDATVAAERDARSGQELETQLIAALKGNLSRDAHDYVCRKLTLVGTAACVPVLAGLLGNKATAHMARYALERIQAPEAGTALREALGSLNGNLKIGVITSLGSRRDAAAVGSLGSLLHDNDPSVARAAALALGAIGSADSATVLQSALHSPAGNQQAVIDGLLHCAEALLAAGKPADALAIYKSLCDESHGRLVRLAATRGMLACEARQA